MNSGNPDRFENYRRERNRRRLDAGPVRDLGRNANVLRQIEEAEAREARNARLTREVQEFFEDATRTAAGIVSQVAQSAEQELQHQIAREMSEFLTATIQRAQEFVQLMQQQGGRVSSQDLEPHVRNLVGSKLDEFRWAGTAQVRDQHIGLDPFRIDVGTPQSAHEASGQDDDAGGPVRGGARGRGEDDDDGTRRLDYEHLPLEIEVVGGDEATAEDAPDPIEGHFIAEALGLDQLADEEVGLPSDAPAVVLWFERLAGDPEQLKTALRVLVHYDAMTKAEARQIFQETVGT
ncbi:MAG: hypothetical protein IPM29_13000 [Planctomycetes bacterium]|nr:hypothetical protein [Planctomycetota bacterium]